MSYLATESCTFFARRAEGLTARAAVRNMIIIFCVTFTAFSFGDVGGWAVAKTGCGGGSRKEKVCRATPLSYIRMSFFRLSFRKRMFVSVYLSGRVLVIANLIERFPRVPAGDEQTLPKNLNRIRSTMQWGKSGENHLQSPVTEKIPIPSIFRTAPK